MCYVDSATGLPLIQDFDTKGGPGNIVLLVVMTTSETSG